MKNLNKFKTRNLLLPLPLLATTWLAVAGCHQTPTASAPTATTSAQPVASPQASTSPGQLQLMFVQTAQDIKADPTAKTIRLVNVSPQTLYFSDRPERVAGNIPMSVYLDAWKAGTNPNDFAKDPPNATLSIHEPGQRKNTLVVVEISQPLVEGKDLIYRYKLIEGTLPKAGGEIAAFIDWYGVGGGVGPGYHGVGVGTRGAGAYGGYGGPAMVR